MENTMSRAQGSGARASWHAAVAAALAVAAAAAVVAQSSGTPQTPRPLSAASLTSLKNDLVIADRILFAENFLDTAGHVSVRVAPDRFLMPWRRAPELIVADDLMVYDLDGNVPDARGRPLVLERFIHAEIYRARPDVGAIVHGHTPSLLLFSSSNIPLRPLFSGAGFIGESVPTFRNGDAGGGVQTAELGRKLAEAMGKGSAVLIRGHGVVVAAPSLVTLVQRSVNLDTNARLVAQLLAMGEKEPIYVRPNPPSGTPQPAANPGGDDSREWEAYRRRAEALMKSN
jgi:HCOMODA/2-hydroxy-3-carboxy-muconic semialdehyde decarboxylase